MKVLKEQLHPQILWRISQQRPGCAFRYLSVPWLNIQNVSLGGGPLEGQMWGSVAKGEWCLIIGQTHDVDGHLGGKIEKTNVIVHGEY